VGAEYFLGGSLASSLQGEPRATNDIDFVIALPLGRVGDLAAALGSDFEVDTAMVRDAILRARCANAFYLPVVTKIDLFGRGYEPFDESECSRRRTTIVTANGESLVVKSAEDTVLRKPGSEKAAKSPRSNGETSCQSCRLAGTRWTKPISRAGRRDCTSLTYSNARAARDVCSFVHEEGLEPPRRDASTRSFGAPTPKSQGWGPVELRAS